MLATKTGEVRFEDPHAAGNALSLDGQQYKGYNVKVQVDLTSHDGTKILVMGLPPECGWQDVKDLMREFGAVAFVQVKDSLTPAGPTGPRNVVKELVGQVRFENADDAWKAIERINGTYIGGQQVSVELEQSATSVGQRSSILVHGLQPSFRWQELKDHFRERIGPVAYAGFIPGTSTASTTAAAALGSMGPKAVGEVRFEEAASAQRALEMFHDFQGHEISLKADLTSVDGTKILVFGLPASCNWQQLKDFVAVAGPVAFVQVKAVGATAVPMTGVAPSGEVRFDHPNVALDALQRSNGSFISGHQVSVEMDPQSVDQCKLRIRGLPPGFNWQSLKDHFSQFGKVAFAQVG